MCLDELNPGGRKTYDPKFLFNLKNTPASQKKPEGLPDLEVVRAAEECFKLKHQFSVFFQLYN